VRVGKPSLAVAFRPAQAPDRSLETVNKEIRSMDKYEETGASTPGRRQFPVVAVSQPKAVAAFVTSAGQGGVTR